ncbi:hypothetical protein Acr_00g0099780 [Actinidia rufa]|uniref:Uncharacterized protein n=1 Tax=Actinidia rufa TaxID=165716 RepID=A0A7J0DZM9_9ERIC|nr:hypothetical protein Acr_00g0099780 [Actinidia rufa]
MTQGELDRLQESCSIPLGIQTKLPEVDETIVSTLVSFYEAAFQVGLGLPIDPTLGEFLPFAMFTPPNWPPMLDLGYLYFKARPRLSLIEGYSNNVKGWKNKFFFLFRGITGSSYMDYLGRLEFRGHGAPQHCNVLPSSTKSEQDRFDLISGTLQQGQFYMVKDIIRSKAFLKSFTLDSKHMASSEGDNAKEKNIGNSATSQPIRVSLTIPETLADVQKKGLLLKPNDKKKGPPAKNQYEAHGQLGLGDDLRYTNFRYSQRKNSSNSGVVLGIKAFAIGNPVAVEKLLQGVMLPIDKKIVGELELDVVVTQFFHAFSQLAKNLESRVAELEIIKQCSDVALSVMENELEGMKKFREEYDVTMEKYGKEMVEMRGKEVLTKK